MKNYKMMSRLAIGAISIALVAGCGAKKEAEAPASTETATPAAETAAPAADAPAAATPVSYDSLKGDATHGGQVFVQCKTCHVIEAGQNRVGPSLHGIIGRTAGSVAGYSYSDANKKSGIVWSEAKIFEYLEHPQKTVPGTKMSFAGLAQAQDRADVIAYLKANAS